MSSIFQRPELAESMANQLLNPGVLDEGYAQAFFCLACAAQVKQRF